MISLKPSARNSYKIGVEEIDGLKEAMHSAMITIQELFKERICWNDCAVEDTEYKSRDGFIPHSENCGGVEVSAIIPKCEESSWPCLEFGECDDAECECKNAEGSGECPAEGEGHYDARVRVWLKFEGYHPGNDELSFYLYAGGGNGDAPYFRSKYESDLFSAEFTCKSVFGLKRAAAKHVKACLAVLNA